MAKRNQGGINIKFALLLIGLVPIVVLAVALSLYSCIRLSKEVKNETFEKLTVAAEGVHSYFGFDIVNNGEVIYDEYSDHAYIESLQPQGVEMTLFKENTRFLTSLKKDNGEYNEGSTAGAGIWETVKTGKNYTSESTVINNVAYFVSYVPVYDADGKVWGMGFAGTPQTKVKEMLTSVIVNIVLLTLGLVAVFTVIIIVLARRIYIAMTGAEKALTGLASGTLNVDTNYVSNISEISQILNAAEELEKQLKTSVGGAKTTASGLGKSVMEVDELAVKSSDDAKAIAHSMEELAITAQSLAETVQDANGSMLEMGDAISSIAAKAEGSTTDAEDMRTINREVASVIRNVKDSNGKSIDAVKEISLLTNECKSAVEQIRTAAEEITGIASQTNLLALNASIESARAGEAGRGFSVVAENIKNLATESANASAGIGQMVNDIISKVDKCVSASDAAAEVMQEQNELVAKAGDSMDNLSRSVASVADNIAAITAETRKLDNAKIKILNNISDLSAISEENAASSEEVASSIEEVSGAIAGVKQEAGKMRDLAVDLDSKMEFFTI